MALSLEEFRDRILAFRSAWKQLAPETEFHGLDLSEFEEQTEESLRLREEIQKLETSLTALRSKRQQADRRSAAAMDRLVRSVRASPEHGCDSSFYRALGYIPDSERKTGLTRRKK